LEAANFPLNDKFGCTLCKFALDIPLDKADMATPNCEFDSVIESDEAWAEWWKHFHKRFQLKN
jgi:hypothetical protein